MELTDEEIKQLWRSYWEVSLNENKQLEVDWFIFKKGTAEQDIFSWFDKTYSKGLIVLMYETYYEEETKWKSTKSSPNWNTVFWYIKAAVQLTKQVLLDGMKNWKSLKKN